MSQGVNTNLIKYLKLKLAQSELSENQQREYKEKIEILRSDIREGSCFGYALTDAALDVFGYGEWWQEVLREIYYWKGTLNELEKPVSNCLHQQ